MTDLIDPTVLVVDDEETVAETYAVRLSGSYETETVYSGEAALSFLEDETAELVLLDRRMPGLRGDEVLGEIRDRGLDMRVVMLTAVDPGFDAIDLPFDDYLCKPVGQESLLAAVDQQFRILALQRLGEYFELLSKRAVIEAATNSADRASVDRYQGLVERCEHLEAQLAAQLDRFDDLEAAFHSVDREP